MIPNVKAVFFRAVSFLKSKRPAGFPVRFEVMWNVLGAEGGT